MTDDTLAPPTPKWAQQPAPMDAPPTPKWALAEPPAPKWATDYKPATPKEWGQQQVEQQAEYTGNIWRKVKGATQDAFEAGGDIAQYGKETFAKPGIGNKLEGVADYLSGNMQKAISPLFGVYEALGMADPMMTGGEIAHIGGKVPEKPVAAPAIKSGEQVFTGPNHQAMRDATGLKDPKTGFVTPQGQFIGREEAAAKAAQAGEAVPATTGRGLHSEDLPPQDKPATVAPVGGTKDGATVTLSYEPEPPKPAATPKPATTPKAPEPAGAPPAAPVPGKPPETKPFTPPTAANPLPANVTPLKPKTKVQSAYEKWFSGLQKEGAHTKLPQDLPARRKRAIKQGFAQDPNDPQGMLTLYHGTGKDYIEFKVPKGSEPAIFLATDPKVSEAYSNKGSAPNIIPAWVKMKNPKTLDMGGKHYSNYWMSSELSKAKAEGHDVVIFKNMHDIGGGGKPQTQYAFFEPANIRAKYGAAFDPKVKPAQAHMLSSAASPDPAPLPERPSKQFITEQDDRLFALRQAAFADAADLLDRVQALPEELKNPDIQKRFYQHMEGDPSANLTPEERALYDRYVKDIKEEERALYEELTQKTALDMKELSPDYAHRIREGKASQFDALKGEASTANPIGGTRSLPRKTSSMNERVYFALEDEKGNRKLVAVKDADLSAVNGKNYTRLPYSGDKPPKVGETITVGGKTWTMKQAWTREIEAETGDKYYQNAIANTFDNVARLRAVARATYEVERLKASPEFAAYARPAFVDGVATKIEKGWREPTMPLFRGWYMDPKLANVIDDFYGKAGGPIDAALNKVNRFAVQSLFWSPVVHAANAGVHWATARGWDWINLPNLKNFAVSSAKAMREVMTTGAKYQQMLREGSGMVYGGVKNREFYEIMMKRLGEDIKRRPAKWDPVARVLGVGPSDLVKMIYEGSSRALWAANDMFMMQRVLELEGKGLSTREAIKEAEKHIPNYRIAPEVLGSRVVHDILANPVISEFGRYHYNMMKSFAHMAVDLVGPKATGKERFDALGNIMATAAIITGAYPIANYGLQKLTGDPNTTWGARGSATIPKDLLDLYNGDKDLVQVLSSLVTMAPALRTALEAFPFNKEQFSGKPVAEPSDLRKGNVGRVAAQEAEHAAKNLIQPYDMLSRSLTGDKPLWKIMRDTAFGITDPAPSAKGKRNRVFHNQDRQAQRRAQKPPGAIEKAYKEVFGP